MYGSGTSNQSVAESWPFFNDGNPKSRSPGSWKWFDYHPLWCIKVEHGWSINGLIWKPWFFLDSEGDFRKSRGFLPPNRGFYCRCFRQNQFLDILIVSHKALLQLLIRKWHSHENIWNSYTFINARKVPVAYLPVLVHCPYQPCS